MPCSITSLPQETLLQIFSYLDVHDRLSVSLVCRQWLQVSNCRQLMQGIYFRIDHDPRQKIQLLLSMSRKFSCFVFNGTCIDVNCFKFMREFGKQFHHLLFRDCDVTDLKLAFTKIENCSNLRALDIIDCDIYLFSSLPNLESLRIKNHRRLNDSDIIELNRTMPNLKSFSLESRIECNAKVYKRFYPKENSFLDQPSNCLLTYNVIEHFIKKRSGTLVSLDLSRSNMTETAILSLSKVNNLKLQHVSFSYCTFCSSVLAEFCQSQRSLTSIDFSCFYNLKEAVVIAVCDLQPHIQTIVLKHCRNLDECVRKIFRLAHLRKIDLTCCGNITKNNFHNAVCEFRSHNLETLVLSDTRITENAITNLVQRARNIRSLNLSFCCVSDANLCIISQILLHLKHLILKGCKQITNAGLTGQLINKVLPSADPYLRLQSHMPTSLSNLKNLVELNLSDCPRLTDFGVIEAVRFPLLQMLDLSGCENLTVSLEKKMREQNPCLRKYVVATRPSSIYDMI